LGKIIVGIYLLLPFNIFSSPSIFLESYRIKLGPIKEKDRTYFLKTIPKLLEAKTWLEKKLRIPVSENVQIIFYRRPSDFSKMNQIDPSDVMHSQTIAITKKDIIHMLYPRSAETSFSFLNTFLHEAVHLFVLRRGNPNLPIWFHEGLAKYYESLYFRQGFTSPNFDEELNLSPEKLFLSERSFISLKESENALAFLLSQSMINFIHNRFGYDKMRKYVMSGKNDQSFRGHFTISFHQIYLDWAKKNLGKEND